MPLRLRSAGGGSVQLNPPVATSTDVVMEVPAYDGAKVLTDKTPGSVLQLISATTNSTISTTSSSDVATGFSVVITPRFATSKIFIQMMGGGLDYGGAASGNYLQVSVYRNGIKLGDIAGGTYGNPYGISLAGGYIDSTHSSTSALTYQIYIKSSGGITGYLLNAGSSISRPLLLTAMEIAG